MSTLQALTANRQLLVAAGGLTIAGTTDHWSGTLDLNNNDLDVPGGSLADLTNQIKLGFNGGSWNGPGGIISTAAVSDSSRLMTLGIILNNTDGSTQIYGTGRPLGTFDKADPAFNDVLVKYTYFGDANLDGRVDGSDYSRIDNGSMMSLTGWFNGDFNYDNVIDGSDYTLIDNAFNTQGAPISDEIANPSASVTSEIAMGSNTSAVPEPAMLGSVITGAGALLTRRPRRRQITTR